MGDIEQTILGNNLSWRVGSVVLSPAHICFGFVIIVTSLHSVSGNIAVGGRHPLKIDAMGSCQNLKLIVGVFSSFKWNIAGPDVTDGLLYIAHEGQEREFAQYEVLVLGPPGQGGYGGNPSAPPF
jgi:hypothetical protein